MPIPYRADAVRTILEVTRCLLTLTQIFHELVAERLQESRKFGGLETGEIRFAYGARTIEAQLDGERLALRHEGHGGEIVKDDLRGYPETLQSLRADIKQPPYGNEMQETTAG